jgi:uncharacterized protein YceK
MIPAEPECRCLIMSYRRAVLLGFALALLLSGCGKVREEGKSNALEAATTAYGSAIRWGYYETALGYLHPDKRAEMPAGLEDIRVTSYDVVQPPLRQDEESATQVVRIEYLHEDVQRVKNLTDRQTWRYDPEAKGWWLHSGLPAFR